MKERFWIIQGGILFLFVGFCGIFYMLGGGTKEAKGAQQAECVELDVLPDAQVEDFAESRMDAYNQAVLLYDQEEKERELQAEHNSFHFFAEEVEEKEVVSVDEAEVDEKNQSALEAFQEIAGVQVAEDKKKGATGVYTKHAIARSSLGGKKTKTEEPEDKELSLEDLEAAKEAEKKEKLERLKELYNQAGHAKKVEVEEKNEVEPEEVPVNAKKELPVNGFKPIGGGVTSENKGTINAVIHGEQRDITSSSQVVLRLLDSIEIEGTTIPRNTTIIGQASFSGNRVHINIENIAYKDNVYPFHGTIYDRDGFRGIYFPDNLADEAKTEAGSETITSTEVNLNGLSGIVSTGANALINATKNVLNNSIKETKVTLPANYKLIIKINS